MLGGTVLVGLSGYVFFVVIGHGRFDAASAAALAATYLLSNILGPGVFIAAEQESSRVISAQRAAGGVAAGTARRLALICAALGVLTLVVLGVCAPLLLAKVLDGDVGLVAALLLAVIGSAAVYYVRGLSGGQQRFHRYAATTGIDGGARIVGCLTLTVFGVADPVGYALALCAGPAIAALLTVRGVAPGPTNPAMAQLPATSAGPTSRRVAHRPTDQAATGQPPAFAVLSRGVAYLLVASFVSLAMANLAPVIVTGLQGTDPAAATGFAAAVVLTRVPLLLMGPIQALILPRLTLAAGSGRLGDFRRDTLLGLAIIGGLAVISLATVAIAGSWALRVLVGADNATASTGVLLLLTGSAMLQMAVQFLQPALVAVRRHRQLVFAWAAGGVAFGLAFLVPLDPIDRGVLAQLVGPVVTLALEFAVLHRVLSMTGTAARQSPS